MEKNIGTIIFFDELSPSSLRLLKRNKNLKAVYYFEISRKINLKKLKGSSAFGKVDFINLKDLEYPFTLYYSQMKSHDVFDRVYEKNINHRRILKEIRRLFSSDDTDLVYKREILDHIQSHLIKEIMLNHVLSSIKSSARVIYYTPFDYSLYGGSTLLAKRVENRFDALPMKMYRFREKVRENVLLLFPFYIFIKCFGGIRFNRERTKIKVGINLNLPRIFSKNYHYFYYLIDPLYNIKKEDYLLIDEKYDPNAVSDESGDISNYYSIYDRMPLSAGCFFDIAGRFLFKWLYCFILSLFQDHIINHSTRIILSDYIKWNVFFDRYDIEKYVDVLMPDHPSKISLFQKKGAETYFIYPDNYTDDYHSGYDESILAQTYFCFMLYDHIVVYGDKTRRYIEKSRNKIGSYLKNGIFHSQKVLEIQQGIYPKKLDPDRLFTVRPKKIIGVFDVAYINWGFLHKKDAINFVESIMSLLDDFEDIGIIFKEKKDMATRFPDVYPVYKKIGEHPRAVYIQKTDSSDIYSYDVISESDLVISASFTSTHAESLGSKTRSIYYDVKGDYKGDNYYFNKFPYMVAHDYGELKFLVKKWLYETEDSEFELYLERYVKGEIDEYLDRKAIDRFRDILYG